MRRYQMILLSLSKVRELTNMNLLLDTCVVIWWLSEPEKLKKKVRSIIADINNEVFVSAASIWEMSIKHRLGRIELPRQLIKTLHDEYMQLLDITAEHTLATVDLPLIHQDPFDRLLIAQAKFEDMTLVTRDKHIQQYPVLTLAA